MSKPGWTNPANSTHKSDPIGENGPPMSQPGSTILVERDLDYLLSLVPIAQTNMMCTGNEDTLSECRYSGADGNPACDHTYDILVDCIGKS